MHTLNNVVWEMIANLFKPKFVKQTTDLVMQLGTIPTLKCHCTIAVWFIRQRIDTDS